MIRQPVWPPFFATAFFLPRIKLRITNAGEELPMTTFGLYVGAYDDRIGNMPSADIGWVDTEWRKVAAGWKPGQTKTLRFKVRSRNLPREGTYVLKILATKFLPLGSPYEQMLELINQDSYLTVEQRQAQLDERVRDLEARGVDPHAAQPGAMGGHGVHTIHIIDYFRVEPISSVLNFALVVSTLLLGFATLGLVVATLTLE